jgi:hypothetical protein
MPSRVATRVIQVGVTAASATALVVVAVMAAHDAPPAASSKAATVGARCPGWTAARLPELQMIDVAAPAPDDVWLLANGGVYHWDGCTWRAHAPFDELSGFMIDWETIDVDPDGAIVITGESEAGPTECHGCMCEATFPSRRQSYRFVAGQAAWEPIEARGRATPEVPQERTLDGVREIIAVSGELAVVDRTDTIAMPYGDGKVGYGTLHANELWRREGTTWSIVLSPPRRDEIATPTRESIFDPLPPQLAGLPDDLKVTAFGGSSASDIWVTGFRADVMPDILHFDGTRWISHRGRFRGDTQYHFTAVSSTGPNDVWVVGSWGTVLHFNGLFWTLLEKPSFVDLVDVVAMPGFVIVRDGGGGVFDRVPWL